MHTLDARADVASDGASSSSAQNAPAETRPRTARSAPLFLVAAFVAALLYQPWRRAQFYPVDFLESVRVMLAHDSFASRFAALFHIYTVEHARPHGPFALWVTAQWELFGWDARGWQLFAFAAMCVVVALAYRALRALGTGRVAAGAGAGLFVVAASASSLWTWELHFPDPPALLCFLGAVIVAAGYQSSRRWELRAALILLLSLAAAFFKETTIATLPFTVLVAVCYRDRGRWDLPGVNRRSVTLAVSGAVMAAAFAALVVGMRRGGTTDEYAGRYGQGMEDPAQYRALVEGMLLPRPGAVTALLFAGIVFLGFALRLRRGQDRRSTAIAYVVALSLPVLGIVAYLPWYYYRPDYAAPFLLGLAMLVAFGTPSRPSDPGQRVLVGAWWTMVAACFLLAARTASHTAQYMFAQRQVLGEVAAWIVRSTASGPAEVSFVIDTTDRQARWFAPKIAHFAGILGAHIRSAPRFAPCADAELASGPGVQLYALLPGDCESQVKLPTNAGPIAATYRFASLRSLRLDSSTVQAYVWRADPTARSGRGRTLAGDGPAP